VQLKKISSTILVFLLTFLLIPGSSVFASETNQKEGNAGFQVWLNQLFSFFQTDKDSDTNFSKTNNSTTFYIGDQKFQSDQFDKYHNQAHGNGEGKGHKKCHKKGGDEGKGKEIGKGHDDDCDDESSADIWREWYGSGDWDWLWKWGWGHKGYN
jgi:hypothetical protein